MKKIIGLILIALIFVLSGCVTTDSSVNKTDTNKIVSDYPTKDISKNIQASKMAEWKALEKTYGPGEVEIFYVGNVKIKRYTYRVNNVTYRVLFYNDKIYNIVTDR
jgi:hypothetical protein